MKKCCEKTIAELSQMNEQAMTLLSAQLGNLEVQNADYQQIVKELSDKLKLYEKKYGIVFKNTSNQR
tara:strand:- start:257 stop:457 length:201 start_codon:yes stop_codon:yes gene_type:complete